ncbi:MAG: T9SS type A sorting domain-containing protein [Candidatus Latescibacteria bacterium]|nr:T9SS type A sorting domain-containing protein [Candidatus Latescibacterota bacterium]
MLYAGGQEGLYKSQDRGDTWKQVFGGGEPVWSGSYYEGGPRSLVVDPRDSQVVFFGGEPGVFRSTDGGQHWQQMSKVNARALAIEPQGLDGVVGASDGRAIYVGGDHRIYQSVDQGETWRLARDSLDVYALAIVPQDHRIVYAGCIEGLYRSLDRGLTWERIHAYSFSQLVVDPRDSQVLYGLRDGFAVFKSTDSGRTWARSGDAPRQARYHALLLDPGEPSTLYAADLNGVYQSIDSGSTWRRIRDASGSYLAMALDARQSQFLYVGTEEWNNEGTRVSSRFYRSEDRGASWQELPLHLQALALAQDPQSPQTLYLSTEAGVYRSGDAGQTWTLVNATQILPELVADPAVPGRLYGGGAGIFVSADSGRTWARNARMSTHPVSALLVDPRPPATLYAQVEGMIYQSQDQGQTWIDQSRGLPQNGVRALALGPGDTLYAGAATGVYRSADQGRNWEQVSVPIRVDVLAVSPLPPHSVYVSTTPSAGHSTSTLHHSDDGGASWSIIPAPPGNPNRHHSMDEPFTTRVVALAVDPRNARGLYASTRSDGLYRTSDSGGAWDFYNPGLPLFQGSGNSAYADRLPRFFSLPAAPGLLYLATDWGLCRIELPAVPQPEHPDTTATASSVWTSTGPSALLYGGFNLGTAVSTLTITAQNPPVLFAGTGSGELFRRTPDGVWAPASQGLPGATVLSLATDPHDSLTVYVGLEGRPALYRTRDSGRTWEPASGNSLFGSVFILAFDPQDPQVMYAGMNTNLMKTSNGGQSWEKVLILSEFAQFSAIAVDPSTPQTVYAGVRDPKTSYGYGQPGTWSQVTGVYKSTDGAKNWRRVMEGRVLAVQVDPLNPQIVYALVGQTGQTAPQVYQSVDGGAGWQRLDTSPIRGSITALMLDPKKGALYVAADNRIFTSSDRGKAWTALETALPNTAIHALAADPRRPGLVYAATGHGVFSNEGLENPDLDTAQFPSSALEPDALPLTWAPAGLGAPVHELVIAPSKPQVMYAVARGVHPSAFPTYEKADLYQRDATGTWTPSSAGQVSGFLLVDPLDPAVLYTDGMNKSDNSGRTWNKVTTDWYSMGIAAAADPRDPQGFYMGGFNYLRRSPDGGRTWKNKEWLGTVVEHFALDPQTPRILYVASRTSGLSKSEDGGGTWRSIALGTSNTVVLDWQDPQQVYALIDSTLYHSDNRGERWYPLPLGLEHPPLTALALDWQHSGTLYVAARGQVYQSVDGGTHWVVLRTGLPDTTISALAVDPLHPQLVYAGTAKGLYSTGTPGAVVVDTAGSVSDTTAATGGDTTGNNSGEDDETPEEETPPLPTITALGQSFPNPFNLQTSTPYQLATSSVVRLEIFDLQGHRVRTIEKGTQPPGFYQEIWHRRDDQGQKLASGVYLVRLQAGSYSAVRKVLLLK